MNKISLKEIFYECSERNEPFHRFRTSWGQKEREGK
jgi:hypothetical protein